MSSLPAYAERVTFVKLSAKKACQYENSCTYLATHNCHVCSTFHCDLHVFNHFDELHEMDLHKNEMIWTLYAPSFGNLGIPCKYAAEEQCSGLAHQLCIICEVALCSNHTDSHDCIGTYHSYQHPKKFLEFECQHCKITFREYRQSDRYADFTGELELFESLKNKGKKKKIAPTCLPCEAKIDEEFFKSPEYIPVILPRIHDGSDDDKVSDAQNQDHERTHLVISDQNNDADLSKDEEKAVDNDCEEGANNNEGYDNHSQDNKGPDDTTINVEVAADNARSDHIPVVNDLSAQASPLKKALSHCSHGSDGKNKI